MLVAARKLHFTNILLRISVLVWQILTRLDPQHLNITAKNKPFQD